MRKIIKSLIAMVLTAGICLSLTGCSARDLSYAAKQGDTKIAAGVYIFYLLNAYDDAAELVPSDTVVLEAEIEGKDAETWIRERAEEYLRAYVWVDNKISELDLDLTEEEKSSASTTTTTMMENISGIEDMGISEDSLNKAYSLFNEKFEKLLQAYYSEGGELEISKEELEEEYCNDAYSFDYMYASLTKEDDDGNTVDLSDEEKDALIETFAGYKETVEKGRKTLKRCAEAYKSDAGLSSAPYGSTGSSPVNFSEISVPEALENEIKSMEAGTLSIVEADDMLVLVEKNDTSEIFENAYADDSERADLLLKLKKDEFNEYVLTKASEETDDLKLNTAAIKNCSISSLVTEKTKYGTMDES